MNELENALQDALRSAAHSAEQLPPPPLDLLRENVGSVSLSTDAARPNRTRLRFTILSAAAVVVIAVAVVWSVSGTTPNPHPTPAGEVKPDWVSVPAPPIPWTGSNESLVTGAGHLIIGTVSAPSPGGSARVQVFDTHTGKWNATDAPPGGMAAVWTGSEFITPFGMFDPATMTWSPNFPTFRDPNYRLWYGVWTGHEAIFLPGGMAYRPDTNSWHHLPSTAGDPGANPPELGGSNPVWTGSQLIGSIYMDAWWTYTPSTNTWKPFSSTKPPNTPMMATAWFKDSLYVLDGLDRFSTYDPKTDIWSTQPAPPIGTCEDPLQLFVENNTILAQSPCNGGSISELAGTTWKTYAYPNDSPAQPHCQAVAIDDGIYDPCANLIFRSKSR